MAARVEIEIATKDMSSGVLRGIVSQLGMFGQGLSDAGNYLNAMTKQSQLSAYALEAVAKNSRDADQAVAALADAEEATSIASARLGETLARLTFEGLRYLYQFSKEGASNLRLIEAGTDLAGSAFEVMIDKIERASLGTVDRMSLVAATNRAMMLGVSRDAEQLANLMEVAAMRARAMGISTTQAFNDIVTGIGRNSPLILDNLGIITKGWAEEAKAAGVAYDQQFILNKVLEQGNEQLERMGGLTRDAAGEIEAFESQWKNFSDSFKASTASATAPLFEQMNKNIEQSGFAIGVLRFGFDDLFVAMKNAKKSEDEYSQSMQVGVEVTQQQVAAWSMGEKAVNGITTATEQYAAAIKEVDYEKLIGDILDYQDAIDDYNEKNIEIAEKESELIAKRREAIETIETLEKRYGSSSQKVQDARKELERIDDALADNGKALKKNEEDLKRWAAQTIFQFAQARAAADGTISEIEGEVLIQAGEALDLFDSKTASAMRSVNKSFDSLDTENAQQVIAELRRQLEYLTSKPWNIQVYTQTFGEPPTGGPLCFLAGTKITMYDERDKDIEKIGVGDIVFSYDTEINSITLTIVKQIFRRTVDSYLVINDRIRVTAEHPFFVEGEWVKSGDLKIGDKLTRLDGQDETVRSISVVKERAEVYNMEVDQEPHNYFADGVLVHNKLQQGGVARAGIPTLVGEAGPEPFIPSVNGRVLGHAESLHALSLGGGGGGTNYFYGPVTIEMSEDSSGLMELR